MPAEKRRCAWCTSDPLYIAYHDEEWGVPVHDDRRLFEMLCLEGAQAGLSWLTILKKRAHYARVFDNWDARKIARYGPDKIAALLNDAGIVRNRLKVEAAVENAKAYLQIVGEAGSLDAYLWRFVDGVPKVNHWPELSEVPARTDLSDALSRDLRRRGFRFVGSTICYAFLQAVGMVDDHAPDCWKRTDQRIRPRRTSRVPRSKA
jgi:DNA-3-methyladenine glycosylase I